MYHIISLSQGLIIVGIFLLQTEIWKFITARSKRRMDNMVAQKKTLARHKLLIHDGVKFCCSRCNYHATSNGSLAEHKRAAHEGVKYPCRLCEYQATRKGYLAEHQKSVHEGVKYPCGQCGKELTSQSSLARH